MKLIKEQYLLIPHVSIGEFRFDSLIKTHLLNNKYTFYPKPKNDEIMEDIYSFENPFLDVFVDARGYITSISCEHFCFYKDLNLINQDVRGIIAFLKLEVTLEEKLWNNIKGKERNYTVYDLDELGIQVWAYRHKIALVSCSNLIEMPNASNNNPRYKR